MDADCSRASDRVVHHASRWPLKVELIRHWCDEAERGLSETFGHDRGLIVHGVEVGVLELWKLWDGDAWMVTRVEAGVLTCCCYQGVAVRDAMRAMVGECRRLNLRAIQFFTRRKGLVRLLRDFEPEEQETVYRIAIT
jgi:hypothetical protein